MPTPPPGASTAAIRFALSLLSLPTETGALLLLLLEVEGVFTVGTKDPVLSLPTLLGADEEDGVDDLKELLALTVGTKDVLLPVLSLPTDLGLLAVLLVYEEDARAVGTKEEPPNFFLPADEDDEDDEYDAAGRWGLSAAF